MARNMASEHRRFDGVGRISTPCISEHRAFSRQGRGNNLINLNDFHTVRRAASSYETRPHFLIYLYLTIEQGCWDLPRGRRRALRKVGLSAFYHISTPFPLVSR